MSCHLIAFSSQLSMNGQEHSSDSTSDFSITTVLIRQTSYSEGRPRIWALAFAPSLLEDTIVNAECHG